MFRLPSAKFTFRETKFIAGEGRGERGLRGVYNATASNQPKGILLATKRARNGFLWEGERGEVVGIKKSTVWIKKVYLRGVSHLSKINSGPEWNQGVKMWGPKVKSNNYLRLTMCNKIVTFILPFSIFCPHTNEMLLWFCPHTTEMLLWFCSSLWFSLSFFFPGEGDGRPYSLPHTMPQRTYSTILQKHACD